jgi:hypothetical protein
MVLYAIFQEVFLAHAFWQGLGAMLQYLMDMARSIPCTCLLATVWGYATVLYAIWQEVFPGQNPGTCLLATAWGNATVLYAILQEVFLAHAFWQGLGAMQ